MPRDLEYEKNNIGYDEPYPEGGIKCKNYELCNAVLPDWWYECKEQYICTNCDIDFGTWGNDENAHYGKGELIFIDNLECPICLEHKRCVSQPRCQHFVCIDCFKRCHFLDQSNDGSPKFPYDSDIEEEYNEESDDSKWDVDYPLIKIYNEMWNEWDDAKREKYDDEEYLRVCPLCRK